jgi:exosortase
MLGIQGETAWSMAILALVATCLGAFISAYGARATRRALFPLLLLALMAPFPPAVLHAIIKFLQHASAEATAVIFEVIGVPVYRQDLLFSLPGLNIRIAEECSGIRSSLALFVMSLLAGHMFLRRAWSRVALVFLVIPLAVVKNGVRIVVLSLLAMHVDPAFITGSVTHRYSGIPLFVASFVIMGGMIWLLQKSETILWRRPKAAG